MEQIGVLFSMPPTHLGLRQHTCLVFLSGSILKLGVCVGAEAQGQAEWQL